jgi:hypothetical protein
MQDTIGEAGGTLQVMSEPGRGTTVIARFGVGGTKAAASLDLEPEPVPSG